MRRQQVAQPNPAPVQIAYHGGLQPHGAINAEGFQQHAAENTWDDGGVARDLVQQDIAALQQQISEVVTRFADTLAKEQAAYGAYQARDAVAEYITKSFMDLAVIDGHACLVLDCSNNDVQFRVWWRLADVIDAAQRSAERSGDRQMLSAIDAVARTMVGATAAMPGDEIKQRIDVQRAQQAAPGRIGGRQMSRR